jgi:hypothetical protein
MKHVLERGRHVPQLIPRWSSSSPSIHSESNASWLRLGFLPARATRQASNKARSVTGCAGTFILTGRGTHGADEGLVVAVVVVAIAVVEIDDPRARGIACSPANLRPGRTSCW